MSFTQYKMCLLNLPLCVTMQQRFSLSARPMEIKIFAPTSVQRNKFCLLLLLLLLLNLLLLLLQQQSLIKWNCCLQWFVARLITSYWLIILVGWQADKPSNNNIQVRKTTHRQSQTKRRHTKSHKYECTQWGHQTN